MLLVLYYLYLLSVIIKHKILTIFVFLSLLYFQLYIPGIIYFISFRFLNQLYLDFIIFRMIDTWYIHHTSEYTSYSKLMAGRLDESSWIYAHE